MKKSETKALPRFKADDEPYDPYHPTANAALKFVASVSSRCTVLGLNFLFKLAPSGSSSILSVLTTVSEHPVEQQHLEGDHKARLFICSASLTTVEDWLSAVEAGVAFQKRQERS